MVVMLAMDVTDAGILLYNGGNASYGCDRCWNIAAVARDDYHVCKQFRLIIPGLMTLLFVLSHWSIFPSYSFIPLLDGGLFWLYIKIIIKSRESSF